MRGLICVHGDGVKVCGSVTWCYCARRNSDGCDVGDDRLCYHWPEVLVEAEENSLVTLLDELGGEFGRLDWCVDERRIVLNNSIVLQRVHEDYLGINEDAVSNDQRNV